MNFLDSTLNVRFHDRAQAGKMLAERLRVYAHQPDVIVCALPRGGVPVAAEIATALGAPLTVFIVRKLGVPGHEELAMGAITTGGQRLMNESVTEALNIPDHVVESVSQRELLELARREQLYSRGRRLPDVKDKTVILTDDGIATGSTMLLAVQALRRRGARAIIVAVPVAPSQTVSKVRAIADQVVCLSEPSQFVAVGTWYQDFHQLDDAEVCRMLDRVFERIPEPQTV